MGKEVSIWFVSSVLIWWRQSFVVFSSSSSLYVHSHIYTFTYVHIDYSVPSNEDPFSIASLHLCGKVLFLPSYWRANEAIADGKNIQSHLIARCRGAPCVVPGFKEGAEKEGEREGGRKGGRIESNVSRTEYAAPQIYIYIYIHIYIICIHKYSYGYMYVYSDVCPFARALAGFQSTPVSPLHPPPLLPALFFSLSLCSHK